MNTFFALAIPGSEDWGGGSSGAVRHRSHRPRRRHFCLILSSYQPSLPAARSLIREHIPTMVLTGRGFQDGDSVFSRVREIRNFTRPTRGEMEILLRF